jgi:hypothetical protein
MKIVMRYDSGKNGFSLAPDECEGMPGGTTAKAYCEYGTSPTMILIEIPGSVVTPEEEAQVLAALEGLKAELQAKVEESNATIGELQAKLEAYEGDNPPTVDPEAAGKGEGK